MKKLSEETREFLLTLIQRELDAEESYQAGNYNYKGEKDECSLDYVKDLIRAQKELLLQDNAGILALVNSTIVDDSLNKFELSITDIE